MHTRRFFAACTRLIILLVTVSILPAPAAAQDGAPQLPPGFVLETVADKLDAPTGFAFAPDGRILVTQKAGAVKVIADGVVQSENFIDLSGEVNQSFDRGLMGVAVHPGWPHLPYAYFGYTYEPPDAQGHAREGARLGRAVRYQADPANLNRALPDSETVILGANSTFANIGNPDQTDTPPFSCQQDGRPIDDCIPQEGQAHGVGMVRFGNDGALYVGVGDGGGYGEGSARAQELDSLSGKILRIDPLTGDGYANNPFYNGVPASNRAKVFQRGLRNPLRFDTPTGSLQLLIGDVGNGAWEEINRGGAGANFGWPCYEGPTPDPTFASCAAVLSGSRATVPPLYRYPHDGDARAVIGGVIYRGRHFPAAWQGAYFFADFVRGVVEAIPAGSSTPLPFVQNMPGPVQLAVGPDGALYVLHIVAGRLDRIRYSGGPVNRAPAANFTATPAGAPLTVAFDATGSVDPDGDGLAYFWDFGDGEWGGSATISHHYAEPGQYDVRLFARDTGTVTGTSEQTVTVGSGQPLATILAPADGTAYRVGARIEFTGDGVDPKTGPLPDLQLQWTATPVRNGERFPGYFAVPGRSGSLVFADQGDDGDLELCLTATADTGAIGNACVNLVGQTVTYTFDSRPRGVPIEYAGITQTTPFTVTAVVGATRPIAAPSPYAGRDFIAWSDGGAAQHDITVRDEDRTFFAIYGRPHDPAAR